MARSIQEAPFGIAVTNARFAALHGLPVALFPFDDARSTPSAVRYALLCALRSTF